MGKKAICGLSAEEIYDLIKPAGYNYNHALKISNGIYKKRISDFSDISNLPGKLIEYISSAYSTGLFKPVASQVSTDNSVKYLFINSVGLRYETVFIPDGKRKTVCVSTQSGCRMGCPFCATGSYGYHGNLSAGEIINQVISLPEAGEVTHVVFMGMGEPMDNIDNVLKACEILTAEWGMALGRVNVTVSTIGIKPGLIKFLENSQCNITLSLYSPFPDERGKVIPSETKYPAGELIRILNEYPAVKKRRFSVAYVMISGVNDTDRHLHELKRIFRGSKIMINLIPYHPVPGSMDKPPSGERMQYIKHELITAGIQASVRRSRGVDISAACGLLATGLNHGFIS